MPNRLFSSSLLPAGLALLVGWLWAQNPSQEPGQTILQQSIHLGDDQTPEWPEAAASPDAGKEYSFSFAASPNAEELCLEITQRHVDARWTIHLNEQLLGTLPVASERQSILLPIPAQLLKAQNRLHLSTSQVGDDITFGPVRLLEGSFRQRMQVRPVQVNVVDPEGHPIPARLTIVDAENQWAPLYYLPWSQTPARYGVAYTDGKGKAVLQLDPQAARIFASHGPEWSVAEANLPRDEQAETVTLTLRREVDTSGWLAADTHIHTYTYSGHGDASLQERILTLAGEGVEVAVATDHNHQTDYRPAQREAGLTAAYLSIVGNEVTTDLGHFNAFPLPADGPRPNSHLASWQALTADMRAKGAQVVILNHPRWPDREQGPFGQAQLDRLRSVFADGRDLSVDAIEIFNSTTPETPWTEVLQDWFALLNGGSRVRGVGSSDSHSVLDPVGQGRTWLRSETSKPQDADIQALCQAFREGYSSMGIGLFGTIRVHGFGPGHLAPVDEETVHIEVQIQGASWAEVESAAIYWNGEVVAQSTFLPSTPGQALRQSLEFRLPRPAYDTWLVCVAQGPKPDAPWWYSLFDDLAWVSNPIWLDANGDGVYQSPAETAAKALNQVDKGPKGQPQITDLAGILNHCDRAIAIQVMVQAQLRWEASFPQLVAQIPMLSSRHRPALEAVLHP